MHVEGPAARRGLWPRGLSLRGLTPSPAQTLGLLLLSSLLFRLLWLAYPPNSLIFDEKYYVNAARVILGEDVAPEDAPYKYDEKGLDPNKEHPPFGKLIIAFSMHWLGSDTFGWRFPAVVLGTFAILCMYGIARALNAGPWLALLASFIFAFDNLVFVHSRIGTLDMVVLAFMLAGFWAYLSGRPLLGGVALALSTLGKLVGLYGWGALVLYEAGLLVLSWHARRRLRSASPALATAAGGETDDAGEASSTPHRPSPRRRAELALEALWLLARPRLARLGIATVAYLLVFFALLWVLDTRYTSFKNPFVHVKSMVTYAVNLNRASGPSFDESYPWQWLANDVQMPYLRVDTEVKVGDELKEKRPIIFFRGGMNPFVVAMAPLALASAVYLAFWYGDILAMFALALFAATHLPNYPPVLTVHRIEYIYYFLLTVPAVALATAQFLRRYNLPNFITWAYLFGVVLGYYDYFPFKAYV